MPWAILVPFLPGSTGFEGGLAVRLNAIRALGGPDEELTASPYPQAGVAGLPTFGWTDLFSRSFR